MKILISIDSFKNSISSADAARNIEKGVHSVSSEIEVLKIPIADGGEGTVEAVIESVGGDYIYKEVADPLFRRVNAKYGIFNHGRSAVIEMAAASGLELLSDNEQNPLSTTTFGTGELINDALSRGIKDILIGIGGSATNDGGIGMAAALGAKFFDKNNNEVVPIGRYLNDITSLNLNKMNDLLKGSNINVICDVTNQLFGPDGASFVYAPQKGASKEEVEFLDKGLIHLSKLIENHLSLKVHEHPGAGAAGGLGYGLMVFTDAKLLSGIEFLIKFLKLPEIIRDVDIVITGEGKIDSQTKYNKTPWGIMKIAKQYNKKIIAIAGMIDNGAREFLQKDFDQIFSLIDYASSISDSIQNPEKYLKLIGARIAAKLVKVN